MPARIRARLAAIDRAQLPSVEQARTIQAEQARQPIVRDRQPPPAIEQTRAKAAPERAQRRERPAAVTEHREPQPTVTARPRGAGERNVGDTAASIASSAGKLIGKVFEALANMISPPSPPTREEQQQAEITRAEREADAAARAAQERHHQLLDQMARDDAERKRLEERDRDTDRGRERER